MAEMLRNMRLICTMVGPSENARSRVIRRMKLVAEPTCAVDAGRPDAAVVIRRTEDLVQNFFLAFTNVQFDAGGRSCRSGPSRATGSATTGNYCSLSETQVATHPPEQRRLRRFICVAPAKRPATERQFNLLTLTAAQRAVRLPGRRRRPIGMPRCSRWASFSSCAMQSAIQVVQPTALPPTKSFDSHSQGNAPIDIAIGCVNRRHILAAVIRPEWSVAGLQAVAGT